MARCYVNCGFMIGLFEDNDVLVLDHMGTCVWRALRKYDLNGKFLGFKCAYKG